jgi:UDP-N-acetylglucosamine 4,6-dehydratase
MTYFVTGITGFLGRALTAALLADPSTIRVIGLSRDEHKIAAFKGQFPDPRVEVRIGDVRDPERIREALSIRPDVVIHAAAMKRVESCEGDPDEAFKTNVLGTRNVVTAARQAGVAKVVVVSSDKAASPETCYGKTKAMAEEIAIGQNAYRGKGQTRISVVRYGNVLGSTGSFLDRLFAARASGEDIPITDPDATRFWWGADEAVAFIRSVIAQMRGAEIWVPKLVSARVTDLARAIAPQSGQVVSGMRGLEKTHELMIAPAEARHAYELADRYVILPKRGQWWSPEPPAKSVPVPAGFTYGSGDTPYPVRLEIQEIPCQPLPS